MRVFPEKIHRNIYFGGLMLLSVSVPVSVFGMSLAQIIIFANWLLEGNFKNKFSLIRHNIPALIFVSLFIVHLLWLWPPQDYQYAMNDLRVKLPILLLPLLFVTSHRLNHQVIRYILILFAVSVTVSSLASFITGLVRYERLPANYRELSIFISHIRYSLNIVFSIVIFAYLLSSKQFHFKTSARLLFLGAAVWLIVFLLILKAMTGIIIFLVISYILLCYITIKWKSKIKILPALFLAAMPFIALYYINSINNKFTDTEQINYDYVKNSLTPGGKAYSFDPDNKSVENGFLVWAWQSDEELSAGWKMRSLIDYYGKDRRGNHIRYTIARFLTSKGLRKDSAGLSKLTDNEISAIEDGIPNYLFLKKLTIYPLVYNILWEIHEYRATGYATGRSLSQRIEYMKAAFRIIKNNFWLGTGTGNVKKAFDETYNLINSQLPQENRRRAHNQIVTFFITFGIFGFIISFLAIFVPFIMNKSCKQFLFTVFFMIAFLSFLNEDTLETQAGVTFFVFFYTLFVFRGDNSIVGEKQ